MLSEGPDLDAVNLQGSIVTFPGLEPGALSVVKSVHRLGVLVRPGLATNTVREIAIGSTASNIKDNVELLVEGGSIVLTGPWVVERRIFLGELSSLPERLIFEVNL